MSKLYFWVLLMAFSLGASSMAAGPLIEEGYFFEGVEGTLKKDAGAETWSFVLSEPVKTNYNIMYPAGEPIPMLPCAVLEQMAGLAGEEGSLRLQLWALFTEYHEKNHLFSVYFLPLDENAAPEEPEVIKEPETTEEQSATQQTDSIIPIEILQQINSQETPDLKKFEKIAVVSGDKNLIGRTGYLNLRNGIRYFGLDGVGLKVDTNNFQLLPNSQLAKSEERLGRSPGRQRYNVSGLVTTYKGKTYMLLRRANRTFSHGNFTD